MELTRKEDWGKNREQIMQESNLDPEAVKLYNKYWSKYESDWMEFAQKECDKEMFLKLRAVYRADMYAWLINAKSSETDTDRRINREAQAHGREVRETGEKYGI